MAKILLIDDEKAIRYALREILEHEETQVDEAEDGAMGLDKAKKGKFDLVLCDIKMPKMDGLEVLEKLQAHDADLPVVMISGHGTIDTAVDALKKGAFDFIQKPPDINRILVSVRNALDRVTWCRRPRCCARKWARPRPTVCRWSARARPCRRSGR
jgi:two-component system nitrogen regulation response regulator NtrX